MAKPKPTPLDAPGRVERRRQRNRAALIASAIELFQERGLGATKVEDICERADVAYRTFFNHFDTRQDLYVAIAEQRANQAAAIFEEVAASKEPFDERLLGLFRVLGAYMKERPAYRELVSSMLHLKIDGGSEATRTRPIGRAAIHLVEDAVSRGEVSTRHRPEVLADLIVGAIMTGLSNWSTNDSYDPEKELVASARALLDVLSP